MRKIAFTSSFKEWHDGTKTTSRLKSVLSFTILLMLTAVSNTSLAQSCTLVCNSGVNVSLPGPGDNCSVTITSAMLMEQPICLTADSVELRNSLGQVMSPRNIVNKNHIGLTLYYRVYERSTGSYCMGTLKVLDKLPPVMTPCRDTMITCIADSRPRTLGGVVPVPTATDCSPLTNFSHEDIITKGTCADTFVAKISRKWIATDDKGYSSSCTQLIVVKRVSLATYTPICPANRELTCSTTKPNTTPDSTGYPRITVDGIPHNVVPGANSLCEFASSYSDEVFPICGGAYKILRTWTIFDWCLPNIPGSINPWTCVQMIKVEDKTAPAITCPPASVRGTVDGTCFGRPNIPPAVVTDVCSNFTVQTLTAFGALNTNGGVISNVPLGVHDITYVATDACGNVNTKLCSSLITIRDDTPPIAVCIQFSVISLTKDGVATVQAAAFSNGSSDNCAIDSFKVSRMANACSPASSFGPTVSFTCCDLAAPVTLILRVFDKAGNSNECMVQATVQDKVDPTITWCPPNLLVECGTPIPVAIAPIFYDNCLGATWSNTEVKKLSTCGIGTITRVYTVRDAVGRSVSCPPQVITVQNSNPLMLSDITWPKDTILAQCGLSYAPADLPANYSRPKIIEDACDIIAVTFNDQILPMNPPACFKVLRKWIVIDWCRYNANNPAVGTFFEHIQVLEIRDNTPPVLTCPSNTTVISTDVNCRAGAVTLAAATAVDCSPSLKWTTTVDYLSNGSIDVNGTSPNLSGSYPFGNHLARIKVEDQCGNAANCSFTILVKDGKRPTPICINGIAAELTADPAGDGGVVNLTSAMFNAGSYDNCTPTAQLVFLIAPSRFTCANVGTNLVTMYVTDQAGNTDYCETYIIIQDNLRICPSGRTAEVNGTIANMAGTALQNVPVNVSGAGTVGAKVMTSKTGQFKFTGLNLSKDYTFTPAYDLTPLNGVSTFDLVLITRHILNMEPLDSPYKVIAADVNKSGTVTTADVLELRRLILAMIPGFTNNGSWRFVDKKHVFQNASNPFQPAFPEFRNVNNLSTTVNDIDFVAIKVGDVNGSASVSNFGEATENRNLGETTSLLIEEQTFKKGDLVSVPIDISKHTSIIGYQFALQFDTKTLEFENVEADNFGKENLGLSKLDEGIIMTSWDNTKNTLQSETGKQNTTLLTVVFRAKTNSTISKQIQISSTHMSAEAYQLASDKKVNLLNLNLEFRNLDATATGFELFQNSPNPYKEVTVIGFSLPEKGQATLSVYDLAGKVLKTVTGAFDAGYNQVQLNSKELGSAGVLFYQLETPQNTATRRMVRL